LPRKYQRRDRKPDWYVAYDRETGEIIVILTPEQYEEFSKQKYDGHDECEETGE